MVLCGEILSRVDKLPTKNYKYHKKYVLAAPTEFIKFFNKKVHEINNKKGMLGGYKAFAKATNLQIWEVNMNNESILERTWRDLL
jgi:hypothetical protein